MGKYSILMISAVLILGFSAAALAHTPRTKENNYGWSPTNADGSPRHYDSPDCENDQPNLADQVSSAIGDNGAKACEGEQWHGNSTFTGSRCDLHSNVNPTADADSFCVANAMSASSGGWQDGTNGPLDVAASGSYGTSGAKVYAGVGIFWVGETAAGGDVGTKKVVAGWYGEDETDKNPVLSPLCKSFFNLNPSRTGPGVTNCLAYWFEIAGIVHGQIGDPAKGSEDDCSFDEYNAHAQANDWSKSCHRDHTSISAQAVLP